jgi:hypothetical protein
VAEKIPYLVISRFGEAWRVVGNQIKNREYTEGAEAFRDISLATAGVNEAVLEACTEIKIGPEILGYPLLEDRWGPKHVSEIIEIQKWLENQGIKTAVAATIPAALSETTKGT